MTDFSSFIVKVHTPDRNGKPAIDAGTASTSVATVTVSGEVDVASAPALRDALIEAVNHGCPDVVVDVNAVRFIDAAGVEALAAEARRARARGIRLRLLGASRPVVRILAMLNLDDLLVSESPAPEAPSLDEPVDG